MRYSFRFPAEYDMGTIRRRVEERHGPFDGMPGLAWKAFAIRERGVEGADDNRYAPVYCWNKTEAMADFLSGPLFRAVADAFGKPRIEAWIPRAFRAGPASNSVPLSLFYRSRPMPVYRFLISASGADFDHARDPALHSLWRGIETGHWRGPDARTWNLVEFSLWTEPAAAVAPKLDPSARGYEIAHFSNPQAQESERNAS